MDRNAGNAENISEKPSQKALKRAKKCVFFYRESEKQCMVELEERNRCTE